MLAEENVWLANNCPESGDLECDFVGETCQPDVVCEGEYTCQDIKEMVYNEHANGTDTHINYAHCDANDDGDVDLCELLECM